jgi:hypothetical protein
VIRRPLPAAVYWRRRLVVLAVVILIVWLIIQIVGLFSDGGDDKPTVTPTPQATPTSTVPLPEGLVSVELKTSDVKCDPQNVRVTPSVPLGQTARQAIWVNFTFATVDGIGCTLEPDDAQLLVVISAKDSPIYDSVVCNANFLSAPVALSEGWSSQVSAKWSGRGSGKKCKASEGFAPAGSYRIQAGTLGGEPGEATFTLAKPTTPDPTPTADPTPTPDPAAPVPLPSSEATTPVPED